MRRKQKMGIYLSIYGVMVVPSTVELRRERLHDMNANKVVHQNGRHGVCPGLRISDSLTDRDTYVRSKNNT